MFPSDLGQGSSTIYTADCCRCENKAADDSLITYMKVYKKKKAVLSLARLKS